MRKLLGEKVEDRVLSFWADGFQSFVDHDKGRLMQPKTRESERLLLGIAQFLIPARPSVEIRQKSPQSEPRKRALIGFLREFLRGLRIGQSFAQASLGQIRAFGHEHHGAPAR